MESAAVTLPFKPISWKLWLGIGVLVLVMYIAILSKSEAAFYMVALSFIFLGLVSYELNFAFYIFSINASATLDPRWQDYALSARWVFLSLFAIGFLLQLRTGVKKIEWTNFHKGVFIFCAINTVGEMDAYVQPLSLYRTISLWLLVVAVCFTIWRYIDSREKITEWIRIAVHVITLWLLIGLIYQGGTPEIAEINEKASRYSGAYVNPNSLGVAAMFQIPYSFFLYRYEKNRNRKVFSYIYLGAFIFGVGSLLRSASRASIGGLLIGTLVAMAIHYRSRLIIIIGVISALIVIGIGPISSAIESKFIKTIVRQKSLKTYGGRDEIWQLGWTLFKKRPILGYGFGTNDILIATKGDRANLKLYKRWGMQSHNSLLRSILESGIVGTVFIVFFILAYPLTLIRVLMKAKSEELYFLLLMFTVFSIAALVNSFFESWLLSVGSMVTFLFWWNVTIVYRIQLHPEDYVTPDDTPREVLYTLK